MRVGDLVTLRTGYAELYAEPTLLDDFGVGVVIEVTHDQVKVFWSKPPFYEAAYCDPGDDWFFKKSLEVIGENR